MRTLLLLTSMLFLSGCSYQANLLGKATASLPSSGISTKPTDATMTIYSAKPWFQDPTPYLTFFGPFEAKSISVYNSADCSGTVSSEKTLSAPVTSFVDVPVATLTKGSHYFSARLHFSDSEQSECITMNTPFVYSPLNNITDVKVFDEILSVNADGSLAVWGDLSRSAALMEKMPQLTSGVTKLFDGVPGALKDDGSFVFWGPMLPDDTSILSSDVVAVARADGDFSVLKANGDVWSWGYGYSPTAKMATNGQKLFSNFYSFAVLKNDGSVEAFGDANNGGSTAAVAASLSSGVVNIFPKFDSYAALKSDGSVVAWGDATYGGSMASVNPAINNGVTSIVSTEYAYAALKSDGSVFAWGSAIGGGSTTAVAASLTSDVVSLTSSSQNGFAALKSDGSVVTWGDSDINIPGGLVASLSSGVTKIVGTRAAFAALKSDGSVVSWGSSSYVDGWTTAQAKVSANVVKLICTERQFYALKSDGSVVGWGRNGEVPTGDALETALASGVVNIFASNDYLAIAQKNDGSYITWDDDYVITENTPISERLPSKPISTAAAGNVLAFVFADGSLITKGHGPAYDTSSVASQLTSGIKKVYANEDAMVALKDNGSVVVWGTGDSATITAIAAQLSSGVVSVSATKEAFAALKSNGSVVVWGTASYGGDATAVAGSLTSGVVKIIGSDRAFAALKSDGSVITWGDINYGGDSSSVAGDISSGVKDVVGNAYDFAALKTDGTVVSWGGGDSADSSYVAADLINVVSITYAQSGFGGAFGALRADGSVITWGSPWVGGDSSAVTVEISSGVTSLSGSEQGFAAMKADGNVVFWGGFMDPVVQLADVTSVISAKTDFLIYKSNGSVTSKSALIEGSPYYAGLLETGDAEALPTDDGLVYIRKDGALIGTIPRSYIEM